MPAFIDLTGRTFGHWSVVGLAPKHGKITMWYCRCVCGTEKVVQAGHLTSGSSQCCGCIRMKARTHGQAVGGHTQFSKKYRTWRYIMNRCTCPGNQDYDRYAGLLCERWKDFSVFDAEVIDPPNDELTIDRIDNAKGYEPGNVRWVTKAEQHRNQSNNVWIEFMGRRQLLSDWAKEQGISASALRYRIQRNGVSYALISPPESSGYKLK